MKFETEILDERKNEILYIVLKSENIESYIFSLCYLYSIKEICKFTLMKRFWT